MINAHDDKISLSFVVRKTAWSCWRQRAEISRVLFLRLEGMDLIKGMCVLYLNSDKKYSAFG